MINRFTWLLGKRYRKGDDDGGSGFDPGEVNAAGNRSRLDRLAQIANTADARRADELQDVDGERPAGPFQGGAYEDDAAAREARAEREEQEALQSLEEQRERAEREEQDEARRLQTEGAGAAHDDDPGAQRSRPDAEASDSDEKLINGVKHYQVVINGQLRWMTLQQLREDRTKAGDVDAALQNARAALQSATEAALRPEPDADEVPDEGDLEDILNSAVLGDSGAIKKLVPLLKGRNQGPTQADIDQAVSKRLATQRLVDSSEAEQAELLKHPVLGSVFRQRFSELQRTAPTTRIDTAYREVGAGIRKDFAAMLPTQRENGNRPANHNEKQQRKRTFVGTPSAASRSEAPADPDREVPVGETIDAIAKSRGQGRAIRQGRR